MMTTIYSIADLHLSDGDKPMDVFGAHWTGHFERIADDWRARVREEDIVLLPGDLSWAMHLADAREHLRLIGALPGRKLLIKGNHDYWWGAISRVREALPDGMYAIQNDGLMLSGTLFAGTRGWTVPGPETALEDVRVFDREVLRLEMTLKAARALDQDAPLMCMMHYPPVAGGGQPTAFSRLLSAYRVDHLFYGHLHGPAIRHAFDGELDGVSYHCVSCDKLHFRLYQLDS